MSEKPITYIDETYGGYSTVNNPVSEYWDIILYLYEDSNHEYIFLINFTSTISIKLSNEKTITQNKWVREVDFEDKARTIRKELRKIGVINDIIFRGIQDYVHYLKINNQYEYYEGNEQHGFLEDYELQQIIQASESYYDLLLKEIKESPTFYPSTAQQYSREFSLGLIVERYNQESYSVLVITGENLHSVLNIVGKTEFENTIRAWRDKGLLVSGDDKGRLTTKYTLSPRYRTNAYIIKIIGINTV